MPDGCNATLVYSMLTLPTGDIGHLSDLINGSGVQFRHTAGDYHYSWHTAPRRQFIVNLDGDVEIEVSSGEKRVIPRGEVFFVEDTTGIESVFYALHA